MSLSLLIIGHGKMGKRIEALASVHGFSIYKIIDKENYSEMNTLDPSKFDVFIDFSDKDILQKNLETMCKLQKHGVIGVTGWNDSTERIDSVIKLVSNSSNGVIFSPNFSIGVNAFFKINEYAAKIFEKFSEYDPFIFEAHHRMKKDSPSGTAMKLADTIITNLKRKDEIIIEPINDIPIKENELHVVSARSGNIFGEHKVYYNSDCDQIELRHTAISRDGFANGALQAAKWVLNKKGFYNIDDMMEDLIK